MVGGNDMQTGPEIATRNRRLGWLMVVLGLFLALGVGFLTVVLGPAMLHPGTSFTGTSQEGINYLILFGLVILFGINSLVGGLRMIRAGRPSRLTFGLTIGLVLLIVGAMFRSF